MKEKALIKFANGQLSEVRAILLENLEREHFALALGKSEEVQGKKIVKVLKIIYAKNLDYEAQSLVFLKVKKDFFYQALIELKNNCEFDTIIDLHTHPFSKKETHFSSTDDNDEREFFAFLTKNFEDVNYASIVFSQESYKARIWERKQGKIFALPALIKTQTLSESIPSSSFKNCQKYNEEQEKIFNRSILALGLDNMRKIMQGQNITIVGLGGLGSVIAEHLIHSAFSSLNLIDNDEIELTNLNRIVGAYYQDALEKKAKVEIIKKHLNKINPHAKISSFINDIHDEAMESIVANSDWLIIATDNHSSRFKAQELCFKYFVPFISVGVNISVANEKITDMSGEVIRVRMGDKLCLNCLKRINYIKVGQESHKDKFIAEELIRKGYVSGKDVKEPAVKTLNTMLATLAVDVLLNQYTERQELPAILVYENNTFPAIYEDKNSLENRNLSCFTCSL